MSAWAPRRVAVLALSASVVLAACSRPAPGEPQDRPPSPQAQVMPAPLAPAQVADSGKIEVDRLIDAGPPAVPLRVNDDLFDAPLAKDPPTHALELVFRQGEPPPLAKGPDVNGAGLDAARRKTEVRAKVDLSPTRMRLAFEGMGTVLPADLEIRARHDRLGHVAVTPGKYRSLPLGTLRAFFAERRYDVAPIDRTEVVPRGEGPRRLGMRTRRVEIGARSSKVVVDLAHVADAGESGLLLCRFFMDLASVVPRTPVCALDEIPVFVEYRWTSRGSFVVEGVAYARRTDVTSAQMLVPPAGSVRTDELLARDKSGRMLSPPELRAMRHGDPTSMAELELTNPSTTLGVVWIDGVAAGWVGPGAQLSLFGLAPGKYQVAWRSVLGDAMTSQEAVVVPGRAQLGGGADAGK